MITSSPFENEVAEPDTYEADTVKYPVSSEIEAIVNKAKSVESVLFDIRKWPLIVDVESSIVRRNACISVELSSRSSIDIVEARVKLALLNFTVPVPGSDTVVFVLNV